MNPAPNNTSASFRPLNMGDLETVMAIERDIYPFPWTRGNFSDSLNAGYSCWVCEVEKKMLGYAVMMVVLDEAQLLNISISRSVQGQGYGRKLLEHMIVIARGFGAKNMFLEVRPSNRSALRLYEKIGFNEFSVRKNYYPNNIGREDALLMGMML